MSTHIVSVEQPAVGLRGEHEGLRAVVPYVVSWSAEAGARTTVIERPGRGIGYLDETLGDRDSHGVLWLRVPFMQGEGRPVFGRIHPVRQRRAQLRLLCGICGGPPDRNERGVLWLVRDHHDWAGWPEYMAATDPPICAPCARLSVLRCPSLRKGYEVLRVGHSRVAGVRGLLYRAGNPCPVPMDEDVVSFEDPATRWILAGHLVRELTQCQIVGLP